MGAFPAVLSTNRDLLVAQNSATGVLGISLDAATTTVIAASATFPEYSAVVIDSEIILLGNLVTGAYLNCTRGFDGTTAAAHTAGTAMNGWIVAKHHNALKDRLMSLEAYTAAGAVNAAAFKFTVTPAVSLAAGVAVAITPETMPSGITSTSPNRHYLRIVDSVAGGETVLVTARTATSFTFTPALAHTAGNYTIESGTDGIQEAVKWVESQPDGGAVKLARGISYTYGTVFLAGVPAVAIFGCGKQASNVFGLFGSGDLFYCDNTSQLLGFYDFAIAPIVPHTSGACIHLKDNTGGVPIVSSVRMVQGYHGMWIDNSDFVTLFNCDINGDGNAAASDLLLISGSSGDVTIFGGIFMAAEINTPDMVDYGIRITGADGISIIGTHVRGQAGIFISPPAGGLIGTVLFSACIIDKCRGAAIDINTISGVPVLLTNILFDTCHIAGWTGMEDTDMISVNVTNLGADRLGLSFVNCLIANANKNGFNVTGANTLTLIGNAVANSNARGTGGSGAFLTNCSNVIVSGNTFEDTRGVPLQQYGVVLGGAISYLSMSGNAFKGNASSSLNNLAAVTLSRVRDNPNLNTIRPTIASAATISVGDLCDTYIISGTTTINTINGATGAGDVRYLFCASSGLAFSAAGNIANALTTSAANQVVTIIWDATDNKWRIR